MSIWMAVVVFVLSGGNLVLWNAERAFIDPAACHAYAARLTPPPGAVPGEVQYIARACISLDRDKATIIGEQAS